MIQVKFRKRLSFNRKNVTELIVFPVVLSLLAFFDAEPTQASTLFRELCMVAYISSVAFLSDGVSDD